MKYLLAFLLSFPALANVQEQAETFDEILKAQGMALEQMDHAPKAGGFKLTELTTDIGFSKSGLMGIAALKSSKGIELKWKRVSNSFTTSFHEDSLLINEEADLESVVDTITGIVESSGKIKSGPYLQSQIRNALGDFKSHLDKISITEMMGWKASAVRLDLNFSTSGKLSFISRAGVAMRLRLEWALKKKPLLKSQDALLNNETKFVAKVLSDLNQIAIPGFKPYKITVGIGASVKKDFFGMWKYSTGFLGAMIFVPVSNPPALVSVLPELDEMKLEIGGFEDEEEEAQKMRWPWRRVARPVVDFSAGMKKSLETATFFMARTQNIQSKNWYLAELKTVNDITKSGVFGLSNVTSRGVIEIDHKRVSP